MKSIAFAPLAAALIALAACGQQESSGNSGSASAVAAKAPPAGTTWAQKVSLTPDGGLLMGNPDAPIKVLEFGSYTCSHCKDFSAESHEPLEAKYVNSGKVSFEYRNFIRDPLDMTVALLARCAGPEAFFPLHTQLFANFETMIKTIQGAGEGAYQAAMTAAPNERFVKLAEMAGLIEFTKQRGLPEAKARQCLADSANAEALAKGVEKATADYQITGTPTLILNGSVLENVASWPLLEERLKGAGA